MIELAQRRYEYDPDDPFYTDEEREEFREMRDMQFKLKSAIKGAYRAILQKSPPGPAPRPGLRWDEVKRRWVSPGSSRHRRFRKDSSVAGRLLKTQQLLNSAAQLVYKQGPPGPPPRPGLEWKEETHRWIRPDQGAGSSPTYTMGDLEDVLYGLSQEQLQDAANYLEGRGGAVHEELQPIVDSLGDGGKESMLSAVQSMLSDGQAADSSGLSYPTYPTYTMGDLEDVLYGLSQEQLQDAANYLEGRGGAVHEELQPIVDSLGDGGKESMLSAVQSMLSDGQAADSSGLSYPTYPTYTMGDLEDVLYGLSQEQLQDAANYLEGRGGAVHEELQPIVDSLGDGGKESMLSAVQSMLRDS